MFDENDWPKSELGDIELKTLDFDMYHCGENGSDKVWGIEFKDNNTYVVYGPRKAKKLNFYHKTHNDTSSALKYANDAIRKKQAKGYKYQSKRVFKETDLNFG